MKSRHIGLLVSAAYLLTGTICAYSDENWVQYKYDSRHSGNTPERSVSTPLGLVGAVPLTDAIFTAPVVADGHVYVVDGSGVAFCLDAETLSVEWRFQTGGGKANCNNVSSPAVAERYLHFGTMAGSYYVLDTANGAVVKEITCDGPILSAPVVANGRLAQAQRLSNVTE